VTLANIVNFFVLNPEEASTRKRSKKVMATLIPGRSGSVDRLNGLIRIDGKGIRTLLRQ